ncbi:MAG TPA: extracellular solute-binding protein [Kiritimatiellia bacterium]
MLRRCLALLACAALPSVAAETRLVVLDPSGTLSRDMLGAFEKAATCRVDVVAGAGQPADVIIASDGEITALRLAEHLTELGTDRIPNLTNIDVRFAAAPYDPEGRYCAPLAWGTYGIIARRKDAKVPTAATWGLVFNPQGNPGKFNLLDNDRAMIAAALNFAVAMESSLTPTKSLVNARSLLLNASARATGLDTSAANANRVQKGELAAAVVSSRDGLRPAHVREQVDYVIPREGSIFWVDCAAIPADAPHPGLAARLVNHLLEPEPGARYASRAHAATPNLAARKLVALEELENAGQYPPLAVMQALQFPGEIPDDQRMLYDQIWQQTASRFGKEKTAPKSAPDGETIPLVHP